MTFLVFVLFHLLSCSSVSSSPNEDVFMGFTGWLHLHRYGLSWTVEDFNLLTLLGEICLATLFTWNISRQLKSAKKTQN